MNMVGKVDSKTSSRILIVEDEIQIAELYDLALRRAGFKCEVLTEGRQALAEFSSNSYGAIIADLNLPNFDGLDFLAAVRKLDAKIPFILVTGYSDHSVIESANDHGVSLVLEKPFPMDQLVKNIRNLIGS